MKILFVCPYLPTPVKRRPLNFILHLARRHELHLRVVATGLELEPPVGVPDFVGRLRADCASVEILRVPLSRVLAHGAAGYLGGESLRTAYTFAHDRFASRLDRDCQDLGIDVVHVDRLRLARLAAAMSRPAVVDLPDCMSWAMSQWASIAGGLRRFIYRRESVRLRQFEGGTLQACGMALVASSDDERALRTSGYRGETRVVPGIIEFLAEGDGGAPRAEKPRLVFHGHLAYPPNVDAISAFAHDVFPALRRRIMGLELAVVGKSPSRSVRSLERIEGVRVLADVPSMQPWLTSALAVIAPMRIGAGHSQKVCEAMHAGRPVIGSPAVAGRVMNEVRSCLLVAATAEEWGEHVARLVADPDAASALGARGRQAVLQSCSGDVVVRMLEEVYAAVIEARGEARPVPKLNENRRAP